LKEIERLIQRHPNDLRASAFRRLARQGMIRQNTPHHLRRDPEKLGAVLIVNLMLPEQPEISFVDESGWLQSMLGTFIPEIPGRQSPQLFIHCRHRRG
jgi:hypothetical protein